MIQSTDFDFTIKMLPINQILDKLQDGLFDYEEDGYANSHIVEFMMLDTKMIPLLLRPTPKKDIWVNAHTSKSSYKVYEGHGLLRALRHFIIDDAPIYDFKVLTELNGKQYSELDESYKKKVKQTLITLYIDNSYWGKDNEQITKAYQIMIESSR